VHKLAQLRYRSAAMPTGYAIFVRLLSTCLTAPQQAAPVLSALSDMQQAACA
jgi:hypothetical protein